MCAPATRIYTIRQKQIQPIDLYYDDGNKHKSTYKMFVYQPKVGGTVCVSSNNKLHSSKTQHNRKICISLYQSSIKFNCQPVNLFTTAVYHSSFMYI